MYSIYHFFASLVSNAPDLVSQTPLERLPYPADLFSCKNVGRFPDAAIRVNQAPTLFTGGELIEFKDSHAYSIPSFNSSIPTGKKLLASVLTPSIERQMLACGDDLTALPIRAVFYLVRGRKQTATKVGLIHGSFFETIPVQQLIRDAFIQVLQERLGEKLDAATLSELAAAFTEQDVFSRVREVENASVKLRFRVMTEAKKEGNILNPTQYPEIEDDTLNLIVPLGDPSDIELEMEKMRMAAGANTYSLLTIKQLKHPFNGHFIVFQSQLA